MPEQQVKDLPAGENRNEVREGQAMCFFCRSKLHYIAGDKLLKRPKNLDVNQIWKCFSS